MDNELMDVPKSPAGVALALGVVALVAASVGGCSFGLIGGAVGLVLGIVALILGINAKKKTDREKGKGGFVCGIIAIILAFCSLITFALSPSALKKVAQDKGLPVIEEYADKFYLGAFGVLTIPEEDRDIFMDEAQSLNE